MKLLTGNPVLLALVFAALAVLAFVLAYQSFSKNQNFLGFRMAVISVGLAGIGVWVFASQAP